MRDKNSHGHSRRSRRRQPLARRVSVACSRKTSRGRYLCDLIADARSYLAVRDRRVVLRAAADL